VPTSTSYPASYFRLHFVILKKSLPPFLKKNKKSYRFQHKSYPVKQKYQRKKKRQQQGKERGEQLFKVVMSDLEKKISNKSSLNQCLELEVAAAQALASETNR